MASQDVSQTAAGKKLSAVSQWWDALRAHLHAHSAEWWLLGWQTAGFALGGLASIFYLRSFPFCKDCMLLLATKGEKTRYFSRTRDMRTAVDDVLGKARDKQLQQAVHAHQAKGADHDGNWSEFCSTMEIRRCLSCRVHRLSFHARRKEKERWKNIEVLAYTTTTLEPLDFA
jgi:hypothetical protein